MPTSHKATVIFPYKTGLPEDVATNTFVFSFRGGPGATPQDNDKQMLHLNLTRFFNDEFVTSIPLAEYYSEYIERSACRIRYVEFDEITGAEVEEAVTVPFTLGPTSQTQDLPLECAATLTFLQNLPGSTLIPEARRRGRIFLGPLNSLANASVVDGTVPLINQDFINRVMASAQFLVDQGEPTQWRWSVYSRTNRVTYHVKEGWMDNEWDTIRSRGARATGRTRFYITEP